MDLEKRSGRVVITGIGAVMPGAVGWEKVWDACLRGESNLREITSFDVSSGPIRVAGEVDDEFFSLIPEEKRDKIDRFSALAMTAAKEVLEDAGVDPMEMRDRIGVYMGSCYSGRKCVDKYNAALYRGGVKRVHPRLMQNNLANACSGEIAILFGLTGANLAYSVGFSSGSYALIQAFNALRLGPLDAILAGGAEAPVLPLVLEELNRLGEMSAKRNDPKKIVRPFDVGRSGFVVSEGSVILFLERLESALSRSARIYAEMKGFGVQYDRNRSVEGGYRTKQMALTMETALRNSDLSSNRVGYVSASGLSTTADDIAETRAIREVFGDSAYQVPVSSIKPITGYAISASEAMETAICALAIHRGVLPPTINLESPDSECDLDYISGGPREDGIDVAMSNSFGIDGNYAAIVLEKFNE